MKKWSLIFTLVVCAWGTGIHTEAIDAKAFLLKEAKHPTVLASQNSHEIIAPASLTKIMTAMIAIESHQLNKIVTIPYEATTVEPTKMGIATGDKFRLIDLVKAAMIESHNDAAMAIGIYLGGSVEGFATLMNEKAALLGMTHTHFTNPCGFDIDDHHSTAHDLALLTDYAIKNRVFNDIAKIEHTHVTELNSHKTYPIQTHNKLLGHYPFAQGIKTGYTSKAGPCLIARAKKADKDLILILLHTKKSRWEMAQKVFDEAFGLDEAKPLLATRHTIQGKTKRFSKLHQKGGKRHLVTRSIVNRKG